MTPEPWFPQAIIAKVIEIFHGNGIADENKVDDEPTVCFLAFPARKAMPTDVTATMARNWSE